MLMFWMDEFCMAVHSTQLWWMASFAYKHVKGWCSNAFKGRWDILLSPYYKFSAKSLSERIVKIGQYLEKLQAKI